MIYINNYFLKFFLIRKSNIGKKKTIEDVQEIEPINILINIDGVLK